MNREWVRDKIDSFWVECTMEEAEGKIFPYLSYEEIEESKTIWKAQKKEENDILLERSSLCYLVSKDLKSIVPYPWYYPYSGQWSAYCPFEEIRVIEVNELNEVSTLYLMR